MASRSMQNGVRYSRILRMGRELFGEQTGVLPRPAGMAAGLCVARLGERQQRLHHQPLREILFGVRAIGASALVGELGDRGAGKRGDEAD